MPPVVTVMQSLLAHRRPSAKGVLSTSRYLERGGPRVCHVSSLADLTVFDYRQLRTDGAPQAIPMLPRSRVVTTRRFLSMILALMITILWCIHRSSFTFNVFKTVSPRTLPQETTNADAHNVLGVASGKSRPDRFTLHLDRQYLAYLPHSGLNNQRIALENGLTLARLLNRTLLVPPIRLGKKPIRYLPFDVLEPSLTLSGNDGLEYCGDIPKFLSLPVECLDHFDKTTVTWDTFFNMSQIEEDQQIIYLPGQSTSQVTDALSSRPNGVIQLKDRFPYQYRFADSQRLATMGASKFADSILLKELGLARGTLLQVGSLFGTGRLALGEDGDLVRTRIRRMMVLGNPTLSAIADSIEHRLPRSYVGIHLRVGDGNFLEKQDQTIQETICLLMKRLRPSDPGATDFRNHPTQNQSTHCLGSDNTMLHMGADGSTHTVAHSAFISTDLRHPDRDPSLLPLRRLFSSLFFLSDFRAQLEPLHDVFSDDGVPLEQYLLPLVEALVVARASWVVGTKGSTFSKYLEQTLWPSYHANKLAI